ncbi:MAG: hypothetical protein R3E96_16495 [Planctomycetota bacterium]
MNWLWLLFAIPFLAVGFFWLIGRRLPARTEGRASREFPCDAETLWQALLDGRAHPVTGPLVQGLLSETGHGNWVEDMGHGEAITVRTVSAERGEIMVRELCAQRSPADAQRVDPIRLTENGEAYDLEIEGVTHIEDGTWRADLPHDDARRRRGGEGRRTRLDILGEPSQGLNCVTYGSGF